MNSQDVLVRLTAVLEARKQSDSQDSYVAGLYSAGRDAILKKIGEEATETVMASKDGEPQRIVHEVADLWFHCMVMLVYENIKPVAVLTELDRRFGQSGRLEKTARARQT
jgi:phosphoribosyl-ATP pyrophosphohydrolase